MATKDSPTSPTKPSPTTNTKANRLPAPTLFVGPPSRNASQLSVSRQANDPSIGKPGRDPLSRQKSALNRQHDPDTATVPEEKRQEGSSTTTPSIKKSSEKDIDAKWREMQSTLNEVELTAQSSTHVFGEAHARALDDLRNAQIELARAWGRGNEDNAASAADDSKSKSQSEVNRFAGAQELASDRHFKQSRARADTATSNTTASTSLSGESSSSTGRGGQLEDETAQDIRLASERRAANERYFRKVDEGVKEVVSKLEVVAEAMRGVEGESRSLWSESSSSTTTSTERTREGQRAGAVG